MHCHILTAKAISRYWYWHRTVSLAVLFAFFSSLASPVIAADQEGDNWDKYGKNRVVIDIIGLAAPVCRVLMNEVYLELEEICKRDTYLFNKANEAASTIVKDGSVNDKDIEKVTDEITTDVLKNNTEVIEKLQEIHSTIYKQVEEYPIDKKKIDELQERAENNAKDAEDIGATNSSEFREYVRSILNWGIYFFDRLGFNNNLLNINDPSGFFINFSYAYYKKYVETSIKDISSNNPHTSQAGVRSLLYALPCDLIMPLFGVSGSYSDNELASILGKAVALEVYKHNARSSNMERVKEATKYVAAKIVGRVVDKICKSVPVNNEDLPPKDPFIVDFVHKFIVGYCELLVLSLNDDPCAVSGMTIEKFVAALPKKSISLQATTIGALSTAACKLERHNIGMSAQRNRFREPGDHYSCVSQLQEDGSSRAICDGRVYQHIDVKRPHPLLPFTFNIPDSFNLGHWILRPISWLFKPFLAVFERDVVQLVLDNKLNSLGLTEVVIEDVSGLASLDLSNQVNKDIKITKIDSDHGCRLTTPLPVVISKGMSESFTFTGCHKGISYALPTEYIIGDDITGKYLHGMIWFRIPPDDTDAERISTRERVPLVSQTKEILDIASGIGMDASGFRHGSVRGNNIDTMIRSKSSGAYLLWKQFDYIPSFLV